MKKLLISLLALCFIASSAYGLNTRATNGPQHIEVCYVASIDQLISGDAVVLETSDPTYPGRQVTGTTTRGIAPYGIVLDSPTATACTNGTWVRVQTYGYNDNVNVINPAGSGQASIAVNQALTMAGTACREASINKLMPGATGGTSTSPTTVTVQEAITGFPTLGQAAGPMSKTTKAKAFIQW